MSTTYRDGSALKIGIMTYHRFRNYGSVLQSYALMKYLQNKGHDVCIINYVPEAYGTRTDFLGAPEGSILRRIAYVIGSFPIRLRVHEIFKDFRDQYLQLSANKYENSADFITHPLDLDVYVTGGDQVWNSRYNFHGDSNGYPYYLDFAPADKRIIAYGSSFGEESMDLTPDPCLNRLIQRYDYVSVRERSGLDKLRTLGRTDGVHVLDPTLLLSSVEWEPLFEDIGVKGPYLLMYEPQRTDAKRFKHYALRIGEERNLRIVKIHKGYTKPNWIDKAVYPSVGGFLALFANAEFVLTNSFHGIAFCLVFNRQFACIPANAANNRVTEMLHMAGLEDRMLDGEQRLNEVLLRNIDFAEVNATVEDKRSISMDYLDRAITVL